VRNPTEQLKILKHSQSFSPSELKMLCPYNPRFAPAFIHIRLFQSLLNQRQAFSGSFDFALDFLDVIYLKHLIKI
jgi:hypothetical protein